MNGYELMYAVFHLTEVVRFLGWVNVILFVIAGSQFLFRRINKYVYANKNTTLKKRCG